MRIDLPRACPKCESKDGWEAPRYQVGSIDGSNLRTEWLEVLCRTCRYPLMLPCADAQTET
jgi:hypothetical protein